MARSPWSGAVVDGRLHGRGSRGHEGGGRRGAARAGAGARRRRRYPTVVLQAVSSEEDGGLGTFAELERDDAIRRGAAAGADRVRGRLRASGGVDVQGRHPRPLRARRGPAVGRARRSIATCVSTPRFAEHERAVNADVAHPLMRDLRAALPDPRRPRLAAATWSSQVPGPRRVRGPPRRPRRRRPRRGPGRAAGGRRPRARRRRATVPAHLGRRRSSRRARRRPTTRGSLSSAPPSPPSEAPPRSSACPTAPTCGSSRPEGIPTVMIGTPGLSARTPSTNTSTSQSSRPCARSSPVRCGDSPSRPSAPRPPRCGRSGPRGRRGGRGSGPPRA